MRASRRHKATQTVRLQLVVARDGSVKEIKSLGGSPVLVVAAEDAAKKWCYETGSKTLETAEFHFHWKRYLELIGATHSKPHYLVSAPKFFRAFEVALQQDSLPTGSWHDQGDLALPNRDFYLKADDKSKEIRSKYETHIARMLRLSGESHQ